MRTVSEPPPAALETAAPPRGGVRVVTVHYRTPERLLACLAALERERIGWDGLDVVVVDNASGPGPDGEDMALALGRAIESRGWGGWVRLVASPDNRGFAAGNNLGLATELEGRPTPAFHALLNPDTEIEPGALRRLARFLEEQPEAGIVGPATELGEGNLQNTAFRFPGIVNAFDEALHLGLVSRLAARWRLQPPPRQEPHPCDWLSGGCLVVRREVVAAVGPMDEGYFLYYEEIDWLRRAGELGFSCWYVPAARIVHHAGASTGLTGEGQGHNRVPRYWFESRRRYFLQNHGRPYKLLADLAWLAGASLYRLRLLVTRRPSVDPPRFFGDFVRFNFLGGRWNA